MIFEWEVAPTGGGNCGGVAEVLGGAGGCVRGAGAERSHCVIFFPSPSVKAPHISKIQSMVAMMSMPSVENPKSMPSVGW